MINYKSSNLFALVNGRRTLYAKFLKLRHVLYKYRTSTRPPSVLQLLYFFQGQGRRIISFLCLVWEPHFLMGILFFQGNLVHFYLEK